jgi:uncharacterized membrane protein YhhN
VTTTAWVLLVLAAAAALVDWAAVARDTRPVEYVCKPLALVLLIGVALAIEPHDPAVRGWFVAALVLSLAGDVLLMLPRDRFVAGLAAFLVAHVAYVIGMLVDGVEPLLVAVGGVVVALGAGAVAAPLLRGIRRTAPAMAPPVVAYMAVISAMVVGAFGTGRGLAIVGALSFYVSDALIGWGRFVRAHAWSRVAVMATYHAGQALLVLSLA